MDGAVRQMRQNARGWQRCRFSFTQSGSCRLGRASNFFVFKILRVSSTCSARARALQMIGNSLEALLPVEGGWKACTVCDSPSLFPSLGTATGANGENILS